MQQRLDRKISAGADGPPAAVAVRAERADDWLLGDQIDAEHQQALQTSA